MALERLELSGLIFENARHDVPLRLTWTLEATFVGPYETFVNEFGVQQHRWPPPKSPGD